MMLCKAEPAHPVLHYIDATSRSPGPSGEGGFLTAHTSISKLLAEVSPFFLPLEFLPLQLCGFRQADALLQSLLGLNAELRSYGLSSLSV